MSTPDPFLGLGTKIYDVLEMSSVAFWNHIMKEHALFYSLLLNSALVPELQKRAHELYQLWPESGDVDHEYSQNNLIMRIRHLLQFKEQVLRSAEQAHINLYLPQADFISFIKHTISEAQFALSTLEGKVNKEEELLFWRNEAAEHTELAGKAILNNKKLQVENFKLANKLKTTKNREAIIELLELSNQGARGLSDKIGLGKVNTSFGVQHSKGNVKSLVTLAMLEHEIEETEYGLLQLDDSCC
jgi:hypothetical protein